MYLVFLPDYYISLVEMSGSGRKRISKWDLQDKSQKPLSVEDFQNNAVPGEAGKLVQNRESKLGGSNSDPKWYGAEANNEHSGEVLDASMPWDPDVKMSPDLDDWKQKKRNYSPKSGLGRLNRSSSLRVSKL